MVMDGWGNQTVQQIKNWLYQWAQGAAVAQSPDGSWSLVEYSKGQY